MADKTRIQLDMKQDLIDLLKEVQEKIGAESRAEVIMKACRMYASVALDMEPDDIVEIKGQYNVLKFRMKADRLLG